MIFVLAATDISYEIICKALYENAEMCLNLLLLIERPSFVCVVQVRLVLVWFLRRQP